jgi:hypothetical protein
MTNDPHEISVVNNFVLALQLTNYANVIRYRYCYILQSTTETKDKYHVLLSTDSLNSHSAVGCFLYGGHRPAFLAEYRVDLVGLFARPNSRRVDHRQEVINLAV